MKEVNSLHTGHTDTEQKHPAVYLPTRFTVTCCTCYSNSQHYFNRKCFKVCATHFQYHYFHQCFCWCCSISVYTVVHSAPERVNKEQWKWQKRLLAANGSQTLGLCVTCRAVPTRATVAAVPLSTFLGICMLILYVALGLLANATHIRCGRCWTSFQLQVFYCS